jgi:betaine-aldehyde dehydrogenase
VALVLRDKKEEFAYIESLNVGHPIRAMKEDLESGASTLDFFSGLYPELGGQTIPGSPNKVLNYTLREPFGAVGRIIPFNHPLMFACEAIAAPLVAGNTVILKPSSITPLSALLLCRELERILPPGVVNVVTGRGSEVGAAIASHPRIRRIALTGSVETGKEIARLGAEHLKIVTLELGGKNPIVIFPDVNVETAVRAAVKGMNFSWTASQSCQSTSRCFVHSSIHDEFIRGLSEAMGEIKLGIPTEEKTEMGCLSSQAQLSKVEQYVSIGKSENSILLQGGARPSDGMLSKGYFFRPTLFDQVRPGSRLASEEIFGPVLSVLIWNDYEEMVRALNEVQYGLTAIIMTNNLSNAHRLAADVQAGYIWINGPTRTRGVPFGGYKMSGIGRQACVEELQSYTQTKSVMVTL